MLLEPSVKFYQNNYHNYEKSKVLSFSDSLLNNIEDKNLTAIVDIGYQSAVYGTG